MAEHIVEYAGRKWLRIEFTPDNMDRITELCPNIFNEIPDSLNADEVNAIIGNTHWTITRDWTGNWNSYGYNPAGSEKDNLERIDENNNRIALYITDYNEENNKPYLDFLCDDAGKLISMGEYLASQTWVDVGAELFSTYVLGYTRFGLTMADDYDNILDHTNLTRTGVTAFGETPDTIYTNANVKNIIINTPNVNSNVIRINFTEFRSTSRDLIITAKIPVFISADAAREYIRTGTIEENTCFNNPDAFNDDEDKDYYIRSWTYQYNKSKTYVSHDENKHRLDINANGNIIKGYVKEGDYYNIKLKAYGDNYMEWTTLDGGTYSGDADTFNSSSQATRYNTYNQYKIYGRDGYVKGGWWDTNIYIYADEADADMSVEHPESVLPINPYDVDETPSPRDTGTNVDTEADLTSQTHDASTGLITLYESSAAALNVLGSALYTANTSFLDGLKIYGESPINSLISVYHCPINLDSFITKEPASAFKVGSNTVTTTGANIVKTYGKIVALGSVLVNPINNDFRDYTNLEYELHLPFSNPIMLDASEIMGKTLTIKATVDPYNLQIRYYIIVNSVVYKFIDASFGKQVAVLGNDGAGKARELRQDIMGITGNAIGIATGLASGNPVLTANNVMQAAGGIYATLETEKREPKKQVVGAFANGCGENDILYPYLSITETLSIAPANLASVYGRPTNLITKLGNLHGFIAAEMPMLEVDCSDTEREELIAAISEGVIL